MLSIKELLKFRKKRLDAKPTKVIKDKKMYNRKNRKWKRELE